MAGMLIGIVSFVGLLVAVLLWIIAAVFEGRSGTKSGPQKLFDDDKRG